jgi:hypothetical protein
MERRRTHHPHARQACRHPGWRDQCPAVVADPDPSGLVGNASRTADLGYLREHIPQAIVRSLDGLERVAKIVRSMKVFAHPDSIEVVAVDINVAIESTLVIAHNELALVAVVETDFGELPHVTCFAGDVNQTILNILVNEPMRSATS